LRRHAYCCHDLKWHILLRKSCRPRKLIGGNVPGNENERSRIEEFRKRDRRPDEGPRTRVRRTPIQRISAASAEWTNCRGCARKIPARAIHLIFRTAVAHEGIRPLNGIVGSQHDVKRRKVKLNLIILIGISSSDS